MDNNKNDDFKSLSDMLSKNRDERKTEQRKADKSIDEILNSLDRKAPAEKKEGTAEAFSDDELKPYNPASEIAYTNDNSADTGATRLAAPPSPEQIFEKKTVKTKEERIKTKRKLEAKKRLDNQRQHRRTFGYIFGAVVLSVSIIFVSVYLGIFILNSALDFSGIATNEFDIQVEIPDGATTSEIAEILTDNRLITMPKLFEIYSQVSDADGKYVGGTFELSSAMSYSRLIDTLQASNTAKKTVQVRIVEGMTAHEIGQLLEENSVCRAEDFEKFYKSKMNLYSFEKRVLVNSLKYTQLEGYLFPDTYEFYQIKELLDNPDATIDTTENAETVAERIYSNFNTKITKAMYKQMNAMGFTLDELMTLASMVQKEAGSVDDMGYIASVFLNRLDNPDEYPCLQSDVTVFYAEENIKPYFDEKEESENYQTIADAYDTYVAKGIPAGPVCNPGIDAINAVLNAPDSNYYYFCANPDTLETFYASTQEEHEANLVLAGLTGGDETTEG